MIKDKIWLVVVAGVVLLGGLGYFCWNDASGVASSDSQKSETSVGSHGGLGKIPRPKSNKARAANRDKPVLSRVTFQEAEDDDDERTPEERQLAERIEKALDDENLDLAIACTAEAMACKNTEIRQDMVDTLGWFGSRALPELTPFLADADEDVRDSAFSEWSMAVSDIEDDAERINVVEMAMQVLTNEDQLEDISSEYIGIDEAVAVASLLRIIESDGPKEGVDKAKETYEFVTGEEFTNREDAERWVAEQQAENAETEP